jgi:hypothetical protein
MEDTKDEEFPEPRVTLFGEEINRSESEDSEKKKEGETKIKEKKNEFHCCHDRYGYHRRCGGGAWGIAILFAGAILLLNTLGIIPWEFWNAISSFWPVILVLVGTSILLGQNWFSRFIVFIMALAAFGSVAIYGLMSVNSPLVGYLPYEAVDFVNNYIK